MKLPQLVLHGAGLLLSLATLVALLAPRIPPDTFWPPLFFAYAFVGLVLLLLLLLLAWMARETGKGMVPPLLCLILCMPAMGRHVQWNRPGPQPEESLLIGTLNTHSLKLLWKDGKVHKGLDRSLSTSFFAAERQPDVLCLQEVPLAYKPVLADWGFTKGHIHRFRNTILLSRFPLTNTGRKEFEGSGNSIIWADMQTPVGKVRVYNAHLQSHSISPETEQLLQAPLDQPETWKGYRTVLGRVRHFTAMRAAQARWLAEEIERCPLPVIVAGDLNDTPQSYSYRMLTRELTDSFLVGGRGFGTTFAGKIPGLRIDYILGGKGLAFTDHQVGRSSLSDHYAVTARVAAAD